MIADGYDIPEKSPQFAYDLENDPEELNNLVDSDPEFAATLLQNLRAELPEISRLFLESQS